MTNGVTPVDPLKPRRRMLPSVSDVVRELGLTTTADAATLFKVARQVCAEELNRVKQGLESEPLEVLVARAETLLDPSLVRPKTAPVPVPPPDPGPPEDPFAETAAVMDLKWTAESKEPFGDVLAPAEAPAPHMAPLEIEESTASVTPEPLEPLDMKTEIAEPPGLGMEAPLAGTAEPMPVPAPRPVHGLLDDEGPGEATLDRLRREAESVDLASVLPRERAVDDAAPAPVYVDSAAPLSRRDTTLPGFAKAPRTRSSWPWLLAAVVVIGAGAFAFLRGRGGAPSSPPAQEPRAQDTQASQAEPAPTAVVVTAPPIETPRPKTEKPAPSTAVKAQRPAERAAKTEKPAPEAAAPSSDLPVSRGAQMLSPDWTAAAIWVIHVGSYKDRPSAEREAAQLAKQTGKPAHAFEVNLGEKGMWYRSAVGEFASADEAGAYKADLAKLVPRVGLVYKVSPVKPR